MSDLHAALSAAFDSVSESEDEAPEPTVSDIAEAEEAPEPAASAAPSEDAPAQAGEEKPEAADKSRDEKGRFAAKEAAKAAEAKKAKPAKAPEKVAKAPENPDEAEPDPAAEKAPEAKPEPSAPTVKPPAGWRPAAREHWAKLPAEVQQEVTRREREASHVLEQSAQARRVAQEFERTIRPFEGMIRSEGSNPLRAVDSLLQTAMALRTAPPAHKAQIIAGIVRSYGIPLDALDAALAGAPQGQGQAAQHPAYQPQSPQQFRDPRLDLLLDQQAQALQRSTSSEAEKFAGEHDFFDDVRDDMADIIELGAKRGLDVSYADAYARAIAMNPEIQKVIKQRDAVKSAATAQAATQRAKAAASSVKPNPAQVSVSASGPKNLREGIEMAWEKSMGSNRV